MSWRTRMAYTEDTEQARSGAAQGTTLANSEHGQGCNRRIQEGGQRGWQRRVEYMHIPDDFAATKMAGVEERSPAMLSPKVDVDPGGAEQADNLLVETVVTGPH